MDSKNLVSITEANQNFSKVTKMVDANGYVVILKKALSQQMVDF